MPSSGAAQRVPAAANTGPPGRATRAAAEGFAPACGPVQVIQRAE